MKELCKDCGIKERARNRTICSSCAHKKYFTYSKRKKYLEKYKQSKMDGKWSVYMLINADEYVGYTNNEWRRMCEHRAMGNDTTDYRVLMKCDTEEDAVELESLLHDMGYPGRHIKAKKIPSH